MKRHFSVRAFAATMALLFTLSACGGGKAPRSAEASGRTAVTLSDSAWNWESATATGSVAEESAAGYGAGYAAGEAAGYAQGYKAGYEEGGGVGYDNGYMAGRNAGYEEGYAAGEAAGYKQGYQSGYDEGGGIGYDNGYAAGEATGYRQGYEGGYDEGGEIGYDNGYAAGQKAASASVSGRSGGGGGTGDASKFNTYNNASQQNTTATYVLNTSSKKVHIPSCRVVPKISPKNYATSNKTLAQLKAAGYKPCGICMK